ncbi:MAG: DMT family transporter [Pseudomonadota bacterium]
MSLARPREERTGLGVALMALAVVFFIATDTSAKWLILAGVAPIQVVFVRYAGHFVLSCLVYLPGAGLGEFRSNAPWRQLFRSLLLIFGTTFNFFALKTLPITLTTTIFFATPIVVTLLAIPVLGERVGIRRFLAVLAGFLGVIVTVQPWGAQFEPAIFLSLGALFCASGYFIMTRLLAGVETNATAQLWSSGLATLLLAPFGFNVWGAPSDLGVALVMALIGAFAGLGHIAATYAHRLADASILAPVIYIQIVLAAISGIVVFSTPPTVWTLLGGLIIVASGLYIWHRERLRTR